MPNEGLSAKLCELDRKIGRLHGSVRMSGSAGRPRLELELENLGRDLEQERSEFRDKIRYSRAPVVRKLAAPYETIEELVDRERTDASGPFSGEWRSRLTAEEAFLLAEYALDLAVQAADHALILSLEAIDSQMRQEERMEAERV